LPQRHKDWGATAVLRCSFLRILAVLPSAGIAVLVLCAASAGAQISPGPLAGPHRFLEGATNCTQCHRLGGQATFKCLDCHREIAGRIAAGRGFHARVVEKSAGSQTCAKCHSDHNGEQFALIKWEPSLSQFDHVKTGWALTGKHAPLACSKCHTAANVAAEEKQQIKVKDLNRTYLGLSRECVTCHKDPHGGRLGTKCEQCHGTLDWKTVPSFDHSRTRYALTGAHIKVACEKCHAPAAPGGPPRWTGLVFDRCTGCHTDVHHGSFAATCQSCHNTASWKSVPAALLSAKFDHNKTKYPLLGKHAEVGCEKCHAAGDFKKEIAFQKCSNCHRPDPHSGQFAKRADKGECDGCHTVAGWKPAKFGLPEHKATSYPLEGKHAKVGCEKCHLPAGKATLYKVKFALCTDCHKDAHEAQFAAAPNLNRCEGCHTVQGFVPSTYTLAKHKTSRFPLVSSHVAVPCGDCHKPLHEFAEKKVARYRFEDRSCTACHQDPHRGQFRERMLKIGSGGKALGCEACHSLSSWKELSKFDHTATEFALVGSHRAVPCADCHKPPNLETSLMNVDFRKAPKLCEDCHKDIHAGQFALDGKATQCAPCHNNNKWKPSLFDHSRTRFPLEGVHKNVRCARCHSDIKVVNGSDVLYYKPTPVQCEACHGPTLTVPATPRTGS
jgi:hypothetical protein